MAHELDRNEATGERAMFAVVRDPAEDTPWHREGVYLKQAPTLREAYRLAGMDFEVAAVPVFVPEGGVLAENGEPISVEGAAEGGMLVRGSFRAAKGGQAIIRLDRKTTLGVVGGDYTPLQNEEAFAPLEPLLDRGVVELETGGTIGEGRRVWMLVRYNLSDPVIQEVFGNLGVVPFGLVTNEHTGRETWQARNTPIRVVCRNTLDMALASAGERAVKVQHSKNVREKVIEAAEHLFAAVIERYRGIAENYAAMKATILTDEQFRALVLESAAPFPPKPLVPEGEHVTVRGYDHAVAVAEQRRAAISSAWREGIGHVGDESAWEAYSGAVEVIDHDTKLFLSGKSRIRSMMTGRLGERKEAVLVSLLQHVRQLGPATN